MLSRRLFRRLPAEGVDKVLRSFGAVLAGYPIETFFRGQSVFSSGVVRSWVLDFYIGGLWWFSTFVSNFLVDIWIFLEETLLRLSHSFVNRFFMRY